jgi:prolycopene isomerase
VQGLSREEYERKKDEVADALVKRLEAHLPGLQEATVYREVSKS